ncbi:GMC oxidoreductase [Variovorax sp. Sphag1AA]|uniref:GMC oxidoreductase n=1 Tax=Variovorax sp. Sphag1AA TaxID=2587027 RepID=UPI00161BF7C1|nr:GMC oxidoreductase [Variovorax sp. Sphag1AA]MBB3178362.1 choline dehydrogenase-like flavoprotein [Variovorax sp. Sphag1AA]
MNQQEQAATAWLSADLAELASDLRLDQPADPRSEPHFDVLIVGSGYGGAMALNELAGWGVDGRPLRIAMLERGHEYVPGSFPSTMADLAGHVRFSRSGDASVMGRTWGLFDMRLGADVNVVLANGLGGGSLINAGVMASPLPAVFADPRWPAGIRKDHGLMDALAEVRGQLQASSSGKFASRAGLMDALGGKPASVLDVTVADEDEADRGIRACNGCRDCATGCNVGAKLSVDATLIAQACARHAAPVRIVTGATVTTFEKVGEYDWKVFVTHTDTSLRRHIKAPYEIRASHLVLAAGTLGSTELLMRARKRKLPVSAVLGERFSANGDNLSTILREPGIAPSLGDQCGPTITRMIDRRHEDPPCVIQDLAIPGPLRRLFEETATTVATVQSLTGADSRRYTGDADEPDVAGIDARLIDNSMVVAVIGHDSANGRLRLPGDAIDGEQGTLGVDWPEVRSDTSFDKHQEVLDTLVAKNGAGARVLPNPVWRPLPGMLERLYGAARGPVLTVHPLGGCPMGDHAAMGVVDEFGRVFDGDSKRVHGGLVVLDGAIVPTSLGINPSLTIAMLARRAMRHLRRAWQFDRLDPATHPADPPSEWQPLRPMSRKVVPKPQESTLIEMTEQMKSRVTIEFEGKAVALDLELRLWFEPQSVSSLIASQSPRQLVVDASRSHVRLLMPAEPWPSSLPLGTRSRPPTSRQALLLEAPLSGTLTLMRHEPSSQAGRTVRGLWAWFLNRGLRDAVQGTFERMRGRGPKPAPPWSELVKSAFYLASRAADVRRLEYDLEILSPKLLDRRLGDAMHWQGRPIRAAKRLTYERAANPVNQWLYAELNEFPNRDPADQRKPLAVDLPYFGRVNVPLVRIASQPDHATALIDMASLLLYLARVMLPLHAWSLRLPDRPHGRTPQRLPGAIPHAPAPQVFDITVDVMRDGTPVRMRLTRYGPGKDSRLNPVMLIHGYSASGTTFAHRLLPEGGLAGHLHAKGHDVWVLDLRSSAGMPTAREPWFFEQMGCQDIPLAIDHICRYTGAKKVDVVAHCMGVAMLSLGLFGKHIERGADRFPELRAALPGRLGRLVISQVGPALVMSPANMARAYLMQWLREFIGLGAFEFTPEKPTSADDMFDRLLAAVPYPREDFFRENPFWPPGKRTPWVGARHRMDALYGVTFKLDGMSDAVLGAIDDFFGPMNLQTVAQVIAFARYGVVTDRGGNGAGMVPGHIRRVWNKDPAHRILSLHSSDNGLLDIATRRRVVDLLNDAHSGGRSVEFRDMGHQDSLVGVNAPLAYREISAFLGESSETSTNTSHDPESETASVGVAAA